MPHNVIAALIIAVYSAAVVYNQKQDDLLGLLAEEKRFLKWLASVGILYLLIKSANLGKLGDAFLGIGLVGFGLQYSDKLSVVTSKLRGYLQ